MRTVLIIDDDPFILTLLEAFLAQKGFRPLTAPDGPQGLALFEAARPDAVLCDLSMPGLSGLGVLAELRRRSPLTPFVVISGSNDVGQAVQALKLGAWDYLLKPLVSLELLPPLLDRLEERALFLREKEGYEARLEEQIRVRTAELERQLREKDVLLAEVHHRVKNNLQIMLVLLGLQRDHATEAPVRRALEAGRQRIHALAMVQDEMHDSDHAVRVGALTYATGLVHHLLQAYDLTEGLRLTLEIEDLGLEPGLAFSCGLILHELVEALGREGPPPGPWSLTFGLRAWEGQGLELWMVEDRGLWARWIPEPDRPSLGWDLVEALAGRHGGAVVWDRRVPGTLTVRLR